MRLVWRLVLSHTVLAVVVVAGLGWSLSSLGGLSSALGELITRDLGAIDEEESLHRAAWSVEIAIRRGWAECTQGRPDSRVAQRIETAAGRLRREAGRIGHRAPTEILSAVGRYQALALRLVRGPTCEMLRSTALHREELSLDEGLTNAWIARLVVLHGALKTKEEAVRRSAVGAIVVGGSVGALALLLSVLVARWLARSVSVPLQALASIARRLGGGDFSPIPPAKGPTEVLELSRDLDRMRAQLEEIDSLKQSFLASISHELRTPLAKIKEALALLGDGAAGPLGAQQARVVSIAREACEREIRLVTALLDVSRLRAGQPVRRDASVDLGELVRRAVADELPDARECGVSIAVRCAESTPRAELDATLVERAIANLVRNAVSVSPPGGEVTVVLEVLQTGPEARPGTWARITVEDRGPGIPAEHRAKIFEPFLSFDVPDRPERVGVGLGLSLAREVVRAHGGEAEILSARGAGAILALWLPLDAPGSASFPLPRRTSR